MPRHTASRTRRGAAGVLGVGLLLSVVSVGTSAASPRHAAAPRGAGATHTRAKMPSKASLLHPKQKYFGVSVPGAPSSLKPLTAIGKETGKTPNLVGYYQDWTRPFDPKRAQSACNAGILPLWTWESWSWEDTYHGRPDPTQPLYSPARIAAGAYDSYIKSTARLVKTVKCPIILRLDHEPNGGFYPWGVETKGMGPTNESVRSKAYVKMFQHVWTLFKQQKVTNVIWMWSPNFIFNANRYNIQALYPGKKYVDVVGIDGYIKTSSQSSSIFTLSYSQLSKFCKDKPWMITETGVANSSNKPKQITELLHALGAEKRIIGMVYFDQKASRADWRFEATAASKKAFIKAIKRKPWAAAKRGSL